MMGGNWVLEDCGSNGGDINGGSAAVHAGRNKDASTALGIT